MVAGIKEMGQLCTAVLTRIDRPELSDAINRT
ncbi:hypothetical protein CECT5772_03199 [Streptococcus equi subsp. ruminatorum CECT 5772]|uniref:Uncharacterized protein n=1 Tax=Streptococcus equi subsp. ruminatorum CECT 5772 TaxID=1051981 RepID=A0A922NVM4_9STRE|nr:hypothetical protein CECT5772_03199 [Streptococcus equi subsp. ruminatorum CECT 5772]